MGRHGTRGNFSRQVFLSRREGKGKGIRGESVGGGGGFLPVLYFGEVNLRVGNLEIWKVESGKWQDFWGNKALLRQKKKSSLGEGERRGNDEEEEGKGRKGKGLHGQLDGGGL